MHKFFAIFMELCTVLCIVLYFKVLYYNTVELIFFRKILLFAHQIHK
jgi:hypothetical protein